MQDVPFAVATLVAVSGSAPRRPGAAMAVAADGRVIGSLSGGCVESAIHELCLQVLRDGTAVLRSFSDTGDDAFDASLTCGGTIGVLVRPADSVIKRAIGLAAADQQVTVSYAVIPGRPGFGGTAMGQGADGWFTDMHTPKPRMIVFGAVDFAAALVRAGKLLGYRVIICDPRPVFATQERFPEADEVVVRWPTDYLRATATDERTVLCVLTHDPRFDVDLMELALRIPAGYVGAMASRRTHARRCAQLRLRGVSQESLARLRSPIGLDLGGWTPEETAIAIAAEIVADRYERNAERLSTARQ